MPLATIYRPLSGKVELFTPYLPQHGSNREWIKQILGGSRVRLEHVHGGNWKISPTHFHRSFMNALANRFGSVKVTIDMREASARCTTMCSEASLSTAGNCECICLGDNHGLGDTGWLPVGDHLLVMPGSLVRYTKVLHRQSAI